MKSTGRRQSYQPSEATFKDERILVRIAILGRDKELGLQKFREAEKGLWTRTKILSPNISYFVAIYALLEDLGQYKCFSWVKYSVRLARSEQSHGINSILF